MPVGFPLNATLPSSGQVQWDGPLNAVLTAIINAVQAKVTSDGLNLQSAVQLNANALASISELKFSELSADDGTASAIWWQGNELWVRDGRGTALQVTANGALNAALNGGIAGLPSGTAAVTFSAGGATYTFTSATGVYATLISSDIQVHNGAGTTYTDIKTSPVNNANYSLTLPSAVPASTQPLVMDATGTLMPATNLTNITALTASNLQATANVTLTGIEPGSGYGVVVANQTGSLSTIQSGTFTEWISVASGIGQLGAPTYGGVWAIPAGAAVDVPLRFHAGDQLQQIIYTTLGNCTTGTLMFTSVMDVGSINTAVIAQKTFNGSTACTMSNGAATMTGTLPYTPTTGTLTFRVAVAAGNTQDDLGTLQITWLKKMV